MHMIIIKLDINRFLLKKIMKDTADSVTKHQNNKNLNLESIYLMNLFQHMIKNKDIKVDTYKN